ncbi:MAG: MotA/TolQ/ExbB proton channel family protein [Chitinophagales bacterium]
MNSKLSAQSILLLGILMYIASSVILYLAGFIYSPNNLHISVLISTLFVVATIMLIALISQLGRESNALDKVETSVIVSKENLEEVKNSLPESWVKDRISKVASLSMLHAEIKEQQMSKIVEERYRISGNMIRFIANAMIFVGLLGTFLGIIQSAQGFESALKGSPTGGPSASYNDISAIIGGLDKALGTSIVGVIASLILGFMLLSVKNFQHHLVTRLEEVSMLRILPFYRKEQSFSMHEAMVDSIEKILPETMRQATSKLQEAAQLLKDSTERLYSSQGNVLNLITNLQSAVQSLDNNSAGFEHRVDTFTKELQNIKETVLQLNGHLQQQQRTYLGLSEDYTKNGEVMQRIGQQVNMSQQNLANYIGAREKMFEELFVQINISLNKLIHDLAKTAQS